MDEKSAYLEHRPHEAFAASRRRMYVEQPGLLEQLDALVSSTDRAMDCRGVVVTGGSGSGKSSLLANWAYRYRKQSPQSFVVEYYVGAQSASTSHLDLMRHVISEIRNRCASERSIPTTPTEIEEDFPHWLALSHGEHIVVVIDAVNQLLPASQGLAWLPEYYHAQLRFVVSTTGGPSLESLLARNWLRIEMPALERRDRAKIVERYLTEHKLATGSIDIGDDLMAGQSVTPLFLHTSLEELRAGAEGRRGGADSGHVAGYYLGAVSTDELFQRVLGRVESTVGEAAVCQVLSFLVTSKNGLAKHELQGLTRLSSERIDALCLAMENHLLVRGQLYGFFHDELARAVKQRYLGEDASLQERRSHLAIAKYFARQPHGPRRVSELPWQLKTAGDEKQLRACLCDVEFIASTVDAGLQLDVLPFWNTTDEQRDIDVLGNVDQFRRRDDATTAAILTKAGSFLMEANAFQASRLALEGALNMSDVRAEQADDSDFRTRLLLGRVLVAMGSYDDARPILEQCVANDDSVDLTESTAEAASALAELNNVMGRFDEAKQLLRRALRIRRELHGDDSSKVASVLSDIGAVLLRSGSVNEALEQLHEAVERIQRDLGPSHPDTIEMLNNLGAAHALAGNFVTAGVWIERSLAVSRLAFGEGSVQVAACLANLGFVRKHQNEPELAEQAYVDALRIYRTRLGEHPTVATVLMNLGNLYFEMGDRARSLDVSRSSVAIRTTAFGATHEETTEAALQLARLLGEFGDYDASMRLYREYLPLRMAQLGAEHEATKRSMEYCAEIERASVANTGSQN